ncbi:hypothetical protein N658DRAFT_512617 [Parathielavia hyrcaniae]|uniref:Gamma-glutamylcyclotransferase AIG2-like domain-containing protein n=1 Tax=Parathielavia hyrcaniae TaxID=113614 RepID=A0AAN6QET7_9PEZI|nr:hypothetical protein N658DRAFT_512617 [Parathielavia hyrcaniae]
MLPPSISESDNDSKSFSNGSERSHAQSAPPPPPPLHPRLISARPPQPVVPQTSHFLEKLADMPDGYLLQGPSEAPAYVYEPAYYFFYGTLMNIAILKGVLELDSDPVLRSAKVYGYEPTNWGQYKALVDSKPGTEVTGCAYMAQSIEEEYKLAYYETNATFMYAGDAQALKERRFDRTLWEAQMGTRLPLKWHRGEQGAQE